MRWLVFGRAGLVVLATSSPALAAPAWARQAVELAQASASADPSVAAPALVTEVALAGLAVGWLWLLACVLVCAADAVRAAPPRPGPFRPALVRVLVAALLGSTVAMAAPAHAAPTEPPAPDVSGLRLPDHPGGGGPRAQTPGRAESPRHPRPGTSVVVRAGDTLWGLTQAALRPEAGPPEVDAGWREVYRLNHARIGPDPDLIHPGLRLRLPSAWPDAPADAQTTPRRGRS